MGLKLTHKIAAYCSIIDEYALEIGKEGLYLRKGRRGGAELAHGSADLNWLQVVLTYDQYFKITNIQLCEEEKKSEGRDERKAERERERARQKERDPSGGYALRLDSTLLLAIGVLTLQALPRQLLRRRYKTTLPILHDL